MTEWIDGERIHVTTNLWGNLASTTDYDADWNQIGQSLYGYDTHGRIHTVTDARNGTTTIWYNDADQISATLSPSPDGVQPGQLTTNLFDNMGRVWATILPDQGVVYSLHDVTGLITNRYGTRVYPVAYSYDAQGRMKTMTTWTNFANGQGAATTTWGYDQYRGWPTSKTYEGNTETATYTYTPAGRLAMRNDEIGSMYYYNWAGDVSVADGAEHNYDRLGRRVSTLAAPFDTFMYTTRVFDEAGNLRSESYSGDPLNGVTITNKYNGLLQRTETVVLNSQGNPVATTRYGYDKAGRINSVTDSDGIAAGYEYVPNSDLIGGIHYTNGSGRVDTAKTYDYLGRLREMVSSTPNSVVSAFAYGWNNANQRTTRTNLDGTVWEYNYDGLGQVTSGRKFWANGTPVAGQQFEYSFDDIGNRRTAGWGGDQNGQNLRYQAYQVNSKNQYTRIDEPQYAGINGWASTNTTVTLLSDRGTYAPTIRQGEYFWGEISTPNDPWSQWMTITNLLETPDGTNVIVEWTTGQTEVGGTPNLFTYYGPPSGMWEDNLRGYNFAMGRAFEIADKKTGGARKILAGYDAERRRIEKRTIDWETTVNTHYVYDGWNTLAELDGQNNIQKGYLWGLDLSGSLNGAGGVGGLLGIKTSTGADIVLPDGNGNTVALIAADNSVTATYEYGPFGEWIEAAGTGAAVNPWRFSCKYEDPETGLLYYGYRYYSPKAGRWISRDPIEEKGGENLYGANRNDCVSKWDRLGLIIGVVNPDEMPYLRAAIKALRAKSAIWARIIDQLEAKEDVVRINFHFKEPGRKEGTWYHGFEKGPHTIEWWPYLGNITEMGTQNLNQPGWQSPVTLLGHELVHALDAIEDWDAYIKRTQTYNQDYDTDEEKWVIRIYEEAGAWNSGEGFRLNHKGNPCSTGSMQK